MDKSAQCILVFYITSELEFEFLSPLILAHRSHWIGGSNRIRSDRMELMRHRIFTRVHFQPER